MSLSASDCRLYQIARGVQMEDNSITATMERIRHLFNKYLPPGRIKPGPIAGKNTKQDKGRHATIDKDMLAAIKLDLRTMGARQVAKKYGLSDTTVYNIKNKKKRFA